MKPGRNCWRIERTRRFAMLVDADAYFRAVRAAILQARHSIFILSWDIDSRVRLVPGGANDGFPEPLGDFLHAVVSSRPGLHAYVLNWDFAMLYALEREWLPVYKLDWRTHRRLAFRMDAKHPVGGSHHQKVVVIDDSLAFVGGLDLTRERWDTSEHAACNPLRRDSDGRPYSPFHDVQAVVDGPAARALGELARMRWQRAENEAIPLTEPGRDLWPDGVVPDLTDVDVAISRTEPVFEGDPGVSEVRQLHLDAIAWARRHLFFENQYFTSGMLADAMAARLAEPNGPEVMVISPQVQSGWLENATMGVLRARVHRRLKKADNYGRYGMYAPQLPGLVDHQCLGVHSKVLAADDDLFSVGSANLSSRSMALDTECNLAIEANGDERIRSAIARLRSRLMAEHLGTTPETVVVGVERCGSLHRAASTLRRPGRFLAEMDPVAPPELDALIPEQALFDPEKPIDPDELVAEFVPREARKPLRRRMAAIGVLAVILALLAIAWRWTPLREWINLPALIGAAHSLENLPFTPVAVVAGFVAASLLMVPVTLLIAVTGIVFGPLHGFLFAGAGVMLSAVASYGLGHWLGSETVRHMLGPRINRLSQRVAKRGILAITVVRMLPIAPFTIVNLVAGASHIALPDFLIGTALGMLPGIALTVTFIDRLIEAVRRPNPGTIATVVIVAALLVGLAVGLRRLLKRRHARQR